MALRRLKYNVAGSTLGTGLGNNPVSDTTISLNTPLKEGGPSGTNIPSIVTGAEVLVLRIDNELVYLTAYTSGATTGTILRAQEGTVIASHSSGANVTVALTKLDIAPAIEDYLYLPTYSAHPLDEDFSEVSINPAFTRVDRSGNSASLTYTQGSGVLSLMHLGGSDASQEWHGFMKPLSPYTFPLTVETCIRVAGPYATNYVMSGIGFSDGLTYGAGKQLVMQAYSNTSNGSGLLLTEYGITNWNSVVTQGTSYGQMQTVAGRLFMRLRWVAANTFSTWWSSDGVSWIPILSNHAFTLTPAYVGVMHSHYGGTPKSITTYEYLRFS